MTKPKAKSAGKVEYWTLRNLGCCLPIASPWFVIQSDAEHHHDGSVYRAKQEIVRVTVEPVKKGMK